MLTAGWVGLGRASLVELGPTKISAIFLTISLLFFPHLNSLCLLYFRLTSGNGDKDRYYTHVETGSRR